MPATLPVHLNIIFYNRVVQSVARRQHVARDLVLFCLQTLEIRKLLSTSTLSKAR